MGNDNNSSISNFNSDTIKAEIKFISNLIVLSNYIKELRHILKHIKLIENLDTIIFFSLNLIFIGFVFLINSLIFDTYLSILITLFIFFIYIYFITPKLVKRHKFKYTIKSWININIKSLDLGIKSLNINIKDINKSFYNKELKIFFIALNNLLNTLADDILIYVNNNSDIFKEKTESILYNIKEIKKQINISHKQIETIANELPD